MRLMRLKYKPVRLIPVSCYQKGSGAYDGDTQEYVGEVYRYGVYEASGMLYDRLEIKLPNGTFVPAYRKACNKLDQTICQDFGHKLIKGNWNG